MASKLYISLIMLFFVCLVFVSADSGNITISGDNVTLFTPGNYTNLSCGIYVATLNTYIPPYGDTNGTYTRVDAWYEYEGTDLYVEDNSTRVLLDLNNQSYNFTYQGDRKWSIWLITDAEEDIDFAVRAGGDNSSSYNFTCLIVNATIKFRVPFYLNIYLYHTDFEKPNDAAATPYLTDFQYVFLTNYSMRWEKRWARNAYNLNYLDKAFSWMPF